MRSNRIFLWIGSIGILLLVLISIQFIWLREASMAEKQETKMHVLRALEHAEQNLRNTNYCFQMYGKAYINPNEAFYIVRQRWNDNGTKGPVDTVQMYYDTEGYFPDSVLYDTRTFRDPIPVTAEIHLKFNASISDTDVYYKERKAFYEKMTGRKLRDIISNRRPVETLFDMKKVDSFLSVALRQEHITTGYSFAFIETNENRIAYAGRAADSNALLHSPYGIRLFADNKFLRPYRLAVAFGDEPSAYGIHFWLFFSLAIVAILVVAFYAFVRLYIKQVRLSELKSDFINNLTHEFNTPMANIALAIETLEEQYTPQPARLKRILDIISIESTRLKENIERALQVATMEKGDLSLRKEQVDLVMLINATLTSYLWRCEQLQGSISFIHSGKAVVSGDETHLLNCICNLLDNAIKYRQGPPVIEIVIEEREDQILMSITDNGQGMSSDVQKHIFEKFYRAQHGNIHNTKGFGLGLSYVHGIVAAHAGRISVRSKTGDGTRFTIHLPKCPSHEAN